MDIATTFGIAVSATMLCAWSSGDHVRQKLGLLLLFVWASSNIAVTLMGFSRAPLVVPTLDAAAAVLVALVGFSNKSRIALIVFAIYGMVGAIHVAAFVLGVQGTYNYYAALNAMFACQLIAVGASGAWMGLHRWADRSRQRLRHHPAHS